METFADDDSGLDFDLPNLELSLEYLNEYLHSSQTASSMSHIFMSPLKGQSPRRLPIKSPMKGSDSPMLKSPLKVAKKLREAADNFNSRPRILRSNIRKRSLNCVVANDENSPNKAMAVTVPVIQVSKPETPSTPRVSVGSPPASYSPMAGYGPSTPYALISPSSSAFSPSSFLALAPDATSPGADAPMSGKPIDLSTSPADPSILSKLLPGGASGSRIITSLRLGGLSKQFSAINSQINSNVPTGPTNLPTVPSYAPVVEFPPSPSPFAQPRSPIASAPSTQKMTSLTPLTPITPKLRDQQTVCSPGIDTTISFPTPFIKDLMFNRSPIAPKESRRSLKFDSEIESNSKQPSFLNSPTLHDRNQVESSQGSQTDSKRLMLSQAHSILMSIAPTETNS
eukprot:TRINITY_DN2829_c0_g1_i3.p1 TRINITY_DN2829_c0_g1~~TRINITY_DN2829_c0_g1_i3.p1  ORF type:complete len:398 (+),score=106.09 TRINITY_DN2829_c0_g1_i3:637-1830(+)